MKTLYVQDIKPGMLVSGETFVIKEIKQASDKNENPYYDLLLGDKTGDIKAKIWSDAITNVERSSLKVGKVVAIDAKVDEYKGASQLTILSANSVDETKLDDYLESSMIDIDVMWGELLGIVGNISDSYIRELLNNMLADPDIMRRLKFWPAGLSIHHDFRGGLLQHILEMLAIAEGLDRFYPEANFDIVRAGIILHDIGKLEEFEVRGISPVYTRRGSLIGHLVLGLEVLNKFKGSDFPEDLLLHLQHIVLSHHGLREYGSPILPSTVEAIIVYQADNLSSKTRIAAKGMREDADEEGLTKYNRWLDTRLWKK